MKNNGEKVDLGLDNYLHIEPKDFEKKYGVFISFNDNQGKEKSSITYEISVIAKRTEAHLWLYSFDKNNIHINDKKPHETIDIIASECNLALFPLEVQSGWLNNSIQIKNSEKIQKNWQEKKIALKKRYDLELVDWYLKTTDENINDGRLLQKAIGQDIFLSFFLTPIYQVYGMITNLAEAEVRIPILPNTSPVTYLSELQINHIYSRFDTITLQQEGQLNDNRSAYDLVTLKDIPVTPSNDIKNGRIKAIYQLNRNSKIIQSMIVDCSIELPYNKGRSFRMEAFEI